MGVFGIKTLRKAAIAAALVVAVPLLVYWLTGTFCFFQATVGFPCPGCGLTRAWLAVVRLDWRQALAYHPLFWFPPLFLAAWLLKYIRHQNKKVKWFDGLCIAAISVFAGVFVVRMIMYFPHTEPMQTNPDAILWQAMRRVRGLFL